MNYTLKTDNSHKINKLRLFKVLQILSFDVVLGSICGGLMATKILGITPVLVWWFVLPIAVWLVYTVDHLSDGLRLGNSAQFERHLFHYKYRKIFIIIIIIVGILTSLIAFLFLDSRIVLFGIFLGGIVLVYLIINILTINKKPGFFSKEFMIAILYTLGIWGGPLALNDFKTSLINWIIMTLFGIVAFTNLIVFSFYEKEKDMANNQFSIVQLIGEKSLTWLIYILGILTLVVIIYNAGFINLNQNQTIALIVIGLMQFALLIIFNFKKIFGKKERFRFFGDFVFVFPLVFLFV